MRIESPGSGVGVRNPNRFRFKLRFQSPDLRVQDQQIRVQDRIKVRVQDQHKDSSPDSGCWCDSVSDFRSQIQTSGSEIVRVSNSLGLDPINVN